MTFENYTRSTLDISAVPVLKKLTHLPVIVDPSHASGRAEPVESLALSAIAAGRTDFDRNAQQPQMRAMRRSAT